MKNYLKECVITNLRNKYKLVADISTAIQPFHIMIEGFEFIITDKNIYLCSPESSHFSKITHDNNSEQIINLIDYTIQSLSTKFTITDYFIKRLSIILSTKDNIEVSNLRNIFADTIINLGNI